VDAFPERVHALERARRQASGIGREFGAAGLEKYVECEAIAG
jgi:hypothetical protein